MAVHIVKSNEKAYIPPDKLAKMNAHFGKSLGAEIRDAAVTGFVAGALSQGISIATTLKIQTVANQPRPTTNFSSKALVTKMSCESGHNGNASVIDILEHVGNGDFGSAARDIAESEGVNNAISSAGSAVRDACKEIGEGLARENQ